MFDSTNPAAIPSDAIAVAGYVDGALYTWPSNAWDAWPNARKLYISVWGPWHRGNTLDIERGDATPDQAGDWASEALQRGVANPKLYFSMANYAQVIASLNKFNVRGPCHLWLADYTNVPHIPNGFDACQWASNPAVTGGDFDLSLCQPWFGL